MEEAEADTTKAAAEEDHNVNLDHSLKDGEVDKVSNPTQQRRKTHCILEPFLTIFQSPEPQVPYLCNNIQQCLCQLMQLIVKPVVMNGIKNPMDYITIDILLPITETDAKNKNLLPSKKFTIRFAAESEITRLQEADLIWLKDISSFRKMPKNS